jgi:hypothetical protein
MSQQNLQQRLHQDTNFAPSERPKRRRPIAAANRPVFAALALTAPFIIAALIHVSSYARLAQLEYRRQALVADARRLEAANSQLRFEIERARAQERVVAVAQHWGMAPADPCSEVDYVLLPAASCLAGADQGLELYAVLRDCALARKVSAVVTTGWGSAAQGAAGGQQVARP